MKPLTRWAASSSTLPTGDSPCMPVKYRWMGDATPLKLEWRPQRGQIPVGSYVSGGVSELGSGSGSSWLRGKKGICWALCEQSDPHIRARAPSQRPFCIGGGGCGGRIRTDDLRVMSPTSCRCSTPHRKYTRADRSDDVVERRVVSVLAGSAASGSATPPGSRQPDRSVCSHAARLAAQQAAAGWR